VELDMAECLACGGQVCTATWTLRSGQKRDGSAFFEQPAFHEALRRTMGFARDHEHLYVGSQACANVWVYHSTWSLAFDHSRAYNSVLGCEQALLGRTAYQVAKEKHLARLGKRDLLIAANQTCLGDAECQALRGAIQRGCGLILTGATAECDENFRQRREPELTDVHNHPRVRYMASCPGRTSQADYSAGQVMRAAMPARAAEIIQALRELAQEGFAAELAGGDRKRPLLFVDVYRAAAGIVAHVVHYGDGQPQGLRLRVAKWLAGGAGELFSPYLEKSVPVQADAEGWIALPPTFGGYCAVKLPARP
jgi:hypothetical protein